jgi:hypothetical protein
LTIAIDTTTTTPVRPGFSGFNNDEAIPIEYWGLQFQRPDQPVSSRPDSFPGGDDSEGFNWQTGLDPLVWVDQFEIPLNRWGEPEEIAGLTVF